MDVVLDRDAFLRGLQMVQNIVEPRQTLPILANVLLDASEETVTVTATDLDVGARVSIPAKVATQGSITLSARKLGEIVKELPAAALAMRVGDNAGVSLRCGPVSYKLVGLAPDDFPPVVPAAPASWITLEAGTLRDMLAQTSFAVSHDESRYALNGILFVVQDQELRLVATDGHRLAVAKTALTHPAENATGIVPRKAVLEITRVLGAGEEIRVALTDNQFVLEMPNFVMTARLIEGQFPNYEAVIPKAQSVRLNLGRAALASALRRVAVMAEDRNKPVKLVLMPGGLRLTASSQELGEAEEVLEIDYAGAEFAIAFNSKYVLDALAPLDKDDVMLELKDGLSPGVVRSGSDESYRCVIMPMRI
ncbi:MAG: DNA polymerase III subunit beta [Candidatus Rokubacteria bacterium]|nr:DNA polymerase III subunit beta [Candidatus Rokubacteria bacterium]